MSSFQYDSLANAQKTVQAAQDFSGIMLIIIIVFFILIVILIFSFLGYHRNTTDVLFRIAFALEERNRLEEYSRSANSGQPINQSVNSGQPVSQPINPVNSDQSVNHVDVS